MYRSMNRFSEQRPTPGIEKLADLRFGGSAVLNPLRQPSLEQLQQSLVDYPMADIYHLGETALLWKAGPGEPLTMDSHLTTSCTKNKLQIVLCCNSDGSDKVPIWIISSRRKLDGFSYVKDDENEYNWRWQQKSRLDHLLFEEWLRRFDARCEGRRVMLLLNHCRGNQELMVWVRRLKIGESMRNIRFQLLPPSSTPDYVYCQKGITHAFEWNYRKMWCSYISKETAAGRNPFKNASLFRAAKWCVDSWNAIEPRVIERCWIRSLVLNQPPDCPDSQPTDTKPQSAQGNRRLEHDQDKRTAINFLLNYPRAVTQKEPSGDVKIKQEQEDLGKMELNFPVPPKSKRVVIPQTPHNRYNMRRCSVRTSRVKR